MPRLDRIMRACPQNIETVALVDRSAPSSAPAERSVVRRRQPAARRHRRPGAGSGRAHLRPPTLTGQGLGAATVTMRPPGGCSTDGEEPVGVGLIASWPRSSVSPGRTCGRSGSRCSRTTTTRCVEHCFETTWDGPMQHADGEVVWGAWMTLAELGRAPGGPDLARSCRTRARCWRGWPPDGVGDYAALGLRSRLTQVPGAPLSARAGPGAALCADGRGTACRARARGPRCRAHPT